MKRIFNLIIDNKFECIVAICMFSNLYPNVLPDALYYLSILGVAFSMIRYGIRSTPRTLPTLVLIGVIALSSFQIPIALFLPPCFCLHIHNQLLRQKCWNQLL